MEVPQNIFINFGMDEVGVWNLTSHSSSDNEMIRQSDTIETSSSQGTNNQGENCSTPNTRNNAIQQVSQPIAVLQKKKINKDQAFIIKRNSGHWTNVEHQTYVEFLQQHHTSAMQSQQNRKNNKIFKLMSQTIGTRSPSQCRQSVRNIFNRSHHQKFNPYTPAGQKRIKKTRKRIHTETQIHISNCIQIKQLFTPEVKPNQVNDDLQNNLYDQDDQMLNYDDEPQRLRVRRYSLDNQDESYNFHQQLHNNYFNEYCYD